MLNLRCMWIPGTLLIGMMGCTTSGSVLEPFDGGQQGRLPVASHCNWRGPVSHPVPQ